MAQSLSVAFISVDSATVFSQYVGEAERIVRRTFSIARANVPCVLFIDEVDALVGARTFSGGGSGHGVELRVLSTLLNEMDGVVNSAGILLVGATNRLSAIDSALLRPGRFERIIHVPMPNQTDRISILKLATSRMRMSGDVDFYQIAQEMSDYSGADINNVVREAALNALRLFQEHHRLDEQSVDISVSGDCFRRALATIIPTYAVSNAAKAVTQDAMKL